MDIIKGRIWLSSWNGHRFLMSSDEFYRRVVVLKLTKQKALFIALKECSCIDCEWMKMNDPLFTRLQRVRQYQK